MLCACDAKVDGFAFAIAGAELGKEVGISNAAAHHVSNPRAVAIRAVVALLVLGGLNAGLVGHIPVCTRYLNFLCFMSPPCDADLGPSRMGGSETHVRNVNTKEVFPKT